MVHYFLKIKKGQSLIELILAIALGVIFIGVAALVVAPILKINTETNEAKVGGAWARELLENVRIWAENDWHNLDGVARGEPNYFHLSTSTDIFTLNNGVESIDVGTTTYKRSFYLEDICRDSVSNAIQGVAPCGLDFLDPSVVKVSVNYFWSPEYATKTFSALVTRFRSKITFQTDWSGGPGENGTTSMTSRFATSSAISVTSTPGALRIHGF